MTDLKDRVSVIVDDMFFNAKINGAASACGRQIERIRSQEQLEGLVGNPPAMVIIDLNSDRLDPVEAIGFFKTHEELRAVPIVGFVSHVQTELIRRAQAAGCDQVLPRSAFNNSLFDIISGGPESLAKRG